MGRVADAIVVVSYGAAILLAALTLACAVDGDFSAAWDCSKGALMAYLYGFWVGEHRDR